VLQLWVDVEMFLVSAPRYDRFFHAIPDDRQPL